MKTENCRLFYQWNWTLLLANYLLTLHKKAGREYDPSTLRSIINRKLKRHTYGHSIDGSTKHQDEAFRVTRESLKAKQKVLKQKGKGNKHLRSQPITDDEINILYERNGLGDSGLDEQLCSFWTSICTRMLYTKVWDICVAIFHNVFNAHKKINIFNICFNT